MIAEERGRVEGEFRALAWRRASLRALEGAGAGGREERLVLLAGAQDGGAAHDCVVRFWQRILAPLPRRHIDAWVCWNVPEPPAEPSVEEVVAYAELAALAADTEVNEVVRQQYWRDRPELIRDPRKLYLEVGGVMTDVVPLVSEGVGPRAGSELDRFVAAHARARGERDSPRFRARLLTNATDTDHRIQRYWALTGRLFGPRITIGLAHDWIYHALARSTPASS
ncbi:hypothetical protein VMT65_05420 [Nocardia sp. CDC153]|uniref:hypothetical protein n=1 Tax=Nocardia sp. CDC153 TaxID=3112167 RepID=UPI002DBCC93C|nr:hypothetical protein [Nocardia sp. CDC153]MEC3952467.1 hypothetical protein [Nocardia sp. CDC153]